MAFEHKNNTGSVFKNDRKEKDTQPDLKGDGKIGGEDYWISVWRNAGRDGKKANFSFSFTPKDTQPSTQYEPGSDVEEDEIPF